MTEKAVLGQAQRILVDATSDIWHKISTWTHASDVEMPDGTPLNTYLTDMNDDINEKFDEKYGSLPNTITDISTFDAIPDLTYGRLHTVAALTDGKYTIPTNHYLYSYSGSHPKTIQRFAVLIDTTDLAHLEMYIADKNIENRWTLTKIATQDQIDDLQQQINDLSTEFNNLNLFVQQSIGGLNQLYQVLQDQMDWLEAELAELQEQLNDLLNELRDFKKAINARVDAVEKRFKFLYGVGSLYITSTLVPVFSMAKWLSEFFGGEWKLIQNAYLHATGYSAEANGFVGSFHGAATVYNVDGTERTVTSEPTYSSFPMSYWGNNSSMLNSFREAGLDRDYSAGFGGSKDGSVSLKVENLPPHRHWFGENNRDRLMGYQCKYDDFSNDHNGYVSVAIPGDGLVMQADGNSVNWKPNKGTHFILSESSNIVPGSAGGIGSSSWGGTRDNDRDYNMVAEPIPIEPVRLEVFVWLRVR